ncbi:hypothetical protein [Magnetospirillum molischianum]|uniref:Uncharacterized protein n=1 Tax=Magnetospirillum molischianum DSM 120 TaxID=1150626 RepID=H8FY81_MAGML|nr:hypothetical protein [Magnetospirillum molischianum]CCG43319.1 hypothetical protein PHAMO_80110 [Magnetospirillum molischianum DSM 120]
MQLRPFKRHAENHYRYTCPVLGVERSYADDMALYEQHMKGQCVGPALIHTMMRASKDPTMHMLAYEGERGEEVFYEADPNAPVKTLPKVIVDRIKSILIVDCFHAPGLTEEDKLLIAEINAGVVPADARSEERPKAAGGRGRVNMGQRRVEKPAASAPLAEKEEALKVGSYADALNKAIERECKTEKPVQPAQAAQEPVRLAVAPSVPQKKEKPTSAPKMGVSEPTKPAEAPAGSAPKMSLLEMAKRMKKPAEAA